MRMFTKVALVVVASGFVVGSLAGCGGDKKPDEVTIKAPEVKTK